MMILFRSLVFLAYLGGSVLVWSVPIVLLGRVLPYRGMCALARSWGKAVLWGLKWICRLEYRVSGMEHLPKGPAVILCKHQSAWETIALRALLPPEQVWVLKRELMRVPVFGWALAPYHPIAIDRSAGRRAVKQLLEEGLHWLNAGRIVIVFPEGTRVAPGERRPYAIGGALLSERSQCPVVPIAHNAGLFWGRRSIRKWPGIIDVMVGPAIDSHGRRADEINRLAEDWIESAVSRLSAAPARVAEIVAG